MFPGSATRHGSRSRLVQQSPVWQNWAGNQRCAPTLVAHPSGTEEIVTVVKEAARTGRPVKVVGSGHSFNRIACTSGTLVKLDRHTRMLDVDREACRVTVQAGMRLSTLNRTLAIYGLALPNLGDIDYQTVAGALSTGTHGTGAAFGCLATSIIGMELVAGDGSVVVLSGSSDPPGLAAARVGLGALGIISSLTLQCVPAFYLRAQEGARRFDEVLEEFDALADGNDHFEFYFTPRGRHALVKRNNRVEGPPRRRPRVKEWVDDVVVANWAFGSLGRLQTRRPRLARRLSKLVPKGSPADYVDRSYRVFTSPRTVRFCEMEYGFPRPAAIDVLREIRAWVQSSGLVIGMPLEVRVTAADDIPLSMSAGRDSCFVAAHVFAGQPYDQYFRGIEAIMSNAGGRPHWAKLHFQTAATLAPRYPRWEEFQQARRRLDPEGVFANDYTDAVIGRR